MRHPLAKPIYKLRPFFQRHTNKIDWVYLSANPKAFDILQIHLSKINWQTLSENPNEEAIDLLSDFPDKIDWSSFSNNSSTAAIHILERNQDKIDWDELSANENAIHLLKKNIHLVSWYDMGYNTNPKIIDVVRLGIQKVKDIGGQSGMHDALNWDHLLERNPNAVNILLLFDKYPFYKFDAKLVRWSNLPKPDINELIADNIYGLSCNPHAIEFIEEHFDKLTNEYNEEDWGLLSANSNALHLLEEHPEKILWYLLSKNPSPRAIALLEQNPDKIDFGLLAINKNPQAISLLNKYKYKLIKTEWRNICRNKHPDAIAMLEENPDQIDWDIIWENPAIFTYDYQAMSQNMQKTGIAEAIAQEVFSPYRLERYLTNYGYEEE